MNICKIAAYSDPTKLANNTHVGQWCDLHTVSYQGSHIMFKIVWNILT